MTRQHPEDLSEYTVHYENEVDGSQGSFTVTARSYADARVKGQASLRPSEFIRGIEEFASRSQYD